MAYDVYFDEIRERVDGEPSARAFADVMAFIKRAYMDAAHRPKVVEELLPYVLEALEDWPPEHRACTPQSWVFKLAASIEDTRLLGSLFRRLLVRGHSSQHTIDTNGRVPRSYRIRHREPGAQEEALAAIITGPVFEHIEHLVFEECAVQSDLFEGLRGSDHPLKLRTVSFQHCDVAPEVLRLLGSLGTLSRLESFACDMYTPSLFSTLAGARAFASLRALTLRKLDIDAHTLGEIQALPCFEHLEHLSLPHGEARLEPGAAVPLLYLPRLVTLDMSHRSWELEQLELFFGALEAPGLTRLDLRYCTLEPQTLWGLRSLIAHSDISELDLTGACIEESTQSPPPHKLQRYFLESLPEDIVVEGWALPTHSVKVDSARFIGLDLDQATLDVLEAMYF